MYNHKLGYIIRCILGVLASIVMDNRVLHNVKLVALTEVNTRGVQNIRSVAIEDHKTSLFLASRFTNIIWFKRVIDAMITDSNVNYVYGRTKKLNDSVVNAKMMDVVACNTDH